MRLKLLLLILIVLPQTLFSQNVILKGNVPEYAGEKFIFSTYSDYITFTEEELCATVVDKNGDFTCSFTTEKTNYVHIKLGVYEAFVFAEPNKEYELLFPERKEKSIADKLNPYFEHVLYHLGIENSSDTELNYQLAFFDEIYTNMISENAYSMYKKSGNIDTEKIITGIDSIFSQVQNSFFNEFKNYKYASFLNLASSLRMKEISKEYFLNNEILYDNPAYMDLFNQVYENYFHYFGRTEEGKQIYYDIGRLKSIKSLKKTLGQDSVLTNEALREFVILKCLHDEFYKDRFSRSAMLTVLDSLADQTIIPEHKEIAQNIKTKVTKLMIGFYPPEFELYDKDSNLISLDSFKGKYVYLGFCTSISYACIKEFKMLENLYKKHKDHFEIVIICLDETIEQMRYFVENEGYPFTFLHYGNQSEVFKDYDIRAFPTYYFIAPDGKLSISPAPSPDQNAEFVIFKKMRANGDI